MTPNPSPPDPTIFEVEQIACHELAARKGDTIIDRAHYEGTRKRVAKTRTLLEGSFLERFPKHRWFMEGVCIQHKNNPLDHLRGILALAEVYPPQDLVASFSLAQECNTYSHHFIRGVLESGAATRSETPPCHPGEPTEPSLDADLGIYQEILEATR